LFTERHCGTQPQNSIGYVISSTCQLFISTKPALSYRVMSNYDTL
jgi:hypothetical protein